jgi:hypothetical protein
MIFSGRTQFSSRQLAQVLSLTPRAPASWNALIPCATDELILPALHTHLLSSGLADQTPLDVFQFLEAIASLNAERNGRILAEAVHVARLLNQIGIHPVALKGLAYLIAGIYPPATRYLQDLDFLIPELDLDRAAQRLLQDGFIRDDSDALCVIRHHYPTLRKPSGPNVELHHRVGLGICDRLLAAAQLLADSRAITLDGATFLLPSPTSLVIHLILHSQLAHPYAERIFPPLRALCDLKTLQAHYGPQINWPHVAETFAQAGQSATLHLHLAQAQDILGLIPPFPLNPGLLDRLRLQRRRFLNAHPWARFLDPTYLILSLFSRRLRLVPGLLRRPSLLLRRCLRRL